MNDGAAENSASNPSVSLPEPAAPPRDVQPTSPLPQPVVERDRSWSGWLIWIVPVLALVAAGIYATEYMRSRGTVITIAFRDAGGIHVGDTPVTVRGVEVGRVVGTHLSQDGTRAIVKVRLTERNEAVAHEGTTFWMVKPDLSVGGITGLGTVLSGPYIEAHPAGGDATASEFTGLDRAPVGAGDGLRVIVSTANLDSLQPGSPIYYRGFQVGAVQDLQLSNDSTHVRVRVFIERRYAPLVRINTRFYSVSGADVRGGVFSGVKVKVDSLQSLISGGLAFATPDNEDVSAAPENFEFVLYPEADKGWEKWAPRIPIDPGVKDRDGSQASKEKLRTVVGGK